MFDMVNGNAAVCIGEQDHARIEWCQLHTGEQNKEMGKGRQHCDIRCY